MKTYDLSICIPPVSQVNYPYVAVPLLKSVASINQYSVAVRDANMDFFSYLTKTSKRFSQIKNIDRLNECFMDFDHPENAPEFLEEWVERNLKQSKIIGFSVSSESSYAWAIRAAQMAKKVNSDALIIFGGPFFDGAIAERTLATNALVSAVAIGEGEKTIVEILRRYDGSTSSSLKNVDGIALRLRDHIVVNRPQLPITDLDSLPFPDYSCISIDDYLNFRVGTRILPILGSRGCIGTCAFCSERNMWGKYRARSPENVVSEIKYQQQKHRIKIFRFNDSLLNADIDRLEKICNLLVRENLDIMWLGNVRIRKEMSSRLLNKMYRAGCRSLWYGIESASPRMLKIMNKGIDIKSAPRVLKETKEAGISVLTFWITDFPGEHFIDSISTINFLRDYGRYINFAHFSEFHLLRRSDMLSNPSEYGIRIHNHGVNGTEDLEKLELPMWSSISSTFRNNGLLKRAGKLYVKQASMHLPSSHLLRTSHFVGWI